MKPAEQTPLSCLRMGEPAPRRDIPKGVINIVPGFGETAGGALVKHPGVDKIAFTGSTEVGRIIMQNAAGTFKRVTLELGGKSPNIVFADADLDSAVNGAMLGLFLNQGQCCCAGSRLLVEEKVYGAMVERLAAASEKRKLGDPFDSDNRARPAGRQDAIRQGDGLHRRGQARRGPVRHRRRAVWLEGLLHQADHFRRCERQHEDRQGRDLRAGDAGLEIQGRR